MSNCSIIDYYQDIHFLPECMQNEQSEKKEESKKDLIALLLASTIHL